MDHIFSQQNLGTMIYTQQKAQCRDKNHRSEMEETSEIPSKSLIFQTRKLLEWLFSYIQLVMPTPTETP